MSGVEEGNSTVPKALIHRRILDAAAERPGVSIERLAEEVSGASPNLVERVLTTYGDPADDEERYPPASQTVDKPGGGTATESSFDSTVEETTSDERDAENDDVETAAAPAGSEESVAPTDAGEATAEDDPTNPTAATKQGATEDEPEAQEPKQPDIADSTADSGPSETGESLEAATPSTYPDPASLTGKQRQVLEAIHANPAATQAEIAAEFDVTPATISAHVNAVEGFEWRERAAFVQHLFADAEPAADEDTVDAEQAPNIDANTRSKETTTMSQTPTESRLDEIEGRLTDLSDRLETTETRTEFSMDADLLHKVIHACMESERISTDEELRIIRALLQSERADSQ